LNLWNLWDTMALRVLEYAYLFIKSLYYWILKHKQKNEKKRKPIRLKTSNHNHVKTSIIPNK
jgi:hypothetical protein